MVDHLVTIPNELLQNVLHSGSEHARELSDLLIVHLDGAEVCDRAEVAQDAEPVVQWGDLWSEHALLENHNFTLAPPLSELWHLSFILFLIPSA